MPNSPPHPLRLEHPIAFTTRGPHLCPYLAGPCRLPLFSPVPSSSSSPPAAHGQAPAAALLHSVRGRCRRRIRHLRTARDVDGGGRALTSMCHLRPQQQGATTCMLAGFDNSRWRGSCSSISEARSTIGILAAVERGRCSV